jgi:MinD-like ATPase involved in chromosome partitioning or flagellar assembly
MIDEPRIALAASPREWAQKLHRHVADHGGARVRATVLHPRDAIDEDYDVLVADDTTSFLTPRLVELLHELARTVLGVYDPGDPRGKEDLLVLGVDAVLPRDAAPEAFVEALVDLAASRGGPVVQERVDPAAGAGRDGTRTPATHGRMTAVVASSGGAGATEVAVALAAACGARGDATVVVDADDVSPSLAPRLGLPVYPNLRAAVDAVEQRTGLLADLLVAVDAGGFWALPGIGSAANWGDLRPARTLEALRAITGMRRQVLVNVGHRIEDVPAPGGAARYGLARHVACTADAIVVVALPTPAGLARLFDWVADLRAFAADVPLHVLCNRAPSSSFVRAEITAEIMRTFAPASLWFAPADPRLDGAAWRQEVVATGPFARAVASMAATAVPPLVVPGRRRWRRRAA